MGEPENDVDHASSRFIDAKLERHGLEIDTQEYRRWTRAMWEAARDALREVRDGQQIDGEIADWLLHTIGELLANQTPQEIEYLLERKKGTSPDSLDIKESKKYAILYVQAAKTKDVKDRTPIKTVADMYGCSKQAVRDWVKQYPSVQWDEYQTSRSTEKRVDSLKRLLTRNAKHFCSHSRAQRAIERRGRKAQPK